MVSTRPSNRPVPKSVFAVHGARRHNRMFQSAISALESGSTFKAAAQIAHRSVKDLLFLVKEYNNERPETRRQLTNKEEREVLSMMLKEASEKGTVVIQDLMCSVQEFIQGLPVQRQQQISFMNGRPSRQFCLGYEQRHDDSFFFAKRSNVLRSWTSLNAESLTTFYAQVAYLDKAYKVGTQRTFCIGTNVLIPREEIRSSVKRCMRLSELWRSSQLYDGCIKILSCVCGDGSFRRPVVLEEGTTGMYTTLAFDYDQPLAGYMALDIGRGEFGNDQFLFVEDDVLHHWVIDFVRDVRNIVTDGHRAFLFYNPMDVKFSARDIDSLWKGSVIPFAIPEHTEKRLLPLVPCYGLWEKIGHEFGDRLLATLRGIVQTKLPVPSVKNCLQDSIRDALTPTAITRSFCDCGLVPLDEVRMFQRARPASVQQPDRFVDVSKMAVLVTELEDKTTEQLFSSRRPQRVHSSHTLALGQSGLLRVVPMCPCKYHTNASMKGTVKCILEVFGAVPGYEFCDCGLFHIPHMCVSRFIFPSAAVSCKCFKCASQ